MNWECRLTVPLSRLQRMILLYEFLKETSMLSASVRENVQHRPETPFQSALLFCVPTTEAIEDADTSAIFQKSQNVYFASSG